MVCTENCRGCGYRDSGSDGGCHGVTGGTTGEESGGNGSEHGVGVDNRGTSLSCEPNIHGEA